MNDYTVGSRVTYRTEDVADGFDDINGKLVVITQLWPSFLPYRYTVEAMDVPCQVPRLVRAQELRIEQ